jgi:uncharacterized protein (TIGR02246 family)
MKRIISLILIIFISAPSLIAVSGERNESDENQIRSRWVQFISHWEAGDAAACASFYTPSGMNIPNAFEANIGREAIEQFYTFLFSNNQSSSYTHTTLDLQVFGNDAVEYGEFTVDWITNEGSAWSYQARMIAHWKKNSADVWEIEKLLFNLPPE